MERLFQLIQQDLSKREVEWSESEEQFECYAAGIEGEGSDLPELPEERSPPWLQPSETCCGL